MLVKFKKLQDKGYFVAYGNSKNLRVKLSKDEWNIGIWVKFKKKLRDMRNFVACGNTKSLRVKLA